MSDNNGKTQEDGKQKSQQNLMEIMKQILAAQGQRNSLQSGERKVKPMDEYKFWKTQPVPRIDAQVTKEGEIDSNHDPSRIPAEPQSLPQGFVWSQLDVTDDAQLEEIYHLLYENYVEDDDERFRFQYSQPFLRWALLPPGWQPEWSVGIRAEQGGRLLAFISAVPAKIKVKQDTMNTVEINFLCVHKKLRSKRMAPVLIKEITRQCHLKGIWQALYTGGRYLPTPLATCRYFHRLLNWSKLYDVGFAYLPPDSTKEEQIEKNRLPTQITLAGFRKMRPEDLSQVQKLLEKYMSKFALVQCLSEKELQHFLLSDLGIVHSYVVERVGCITDFVSFYHIDSSVLEKGAPTQTIKMAYSYYYATDASSDEELKVRLIELHKAALIKARDGAFDVFNSLSLMDAPLFLENLKFSGGDGLLHYYLFNYQLQPLVSGIDENGDLTKPGDVGVVML